MLIVLERAYEISHISREGNDVIYAIHIATFNKIERNLFHLRKKLHTIARVKETLGKRKAIVD